MSDNKKTMIAFVIVLSVGIIWLISPNKEDEDKKIYIHSLKLNLTGIVKQVTPTNDHDYGVIYLKNVKSNKENNYESSFKDKYLFCKINNGEAIIVTPAVSDIEVSDSIFINTEHSKYWVYRKNLLMSKINFWLNPDESFYGPLNINGYLDFGYYHKK